MLIEPIQNILITVLSFIKEILDALQKETFESNGLKEFVSANTSNILPVILMSARFATF